MRFIQITLSHFFGKKSGSKKEKVSTPLPTFKEMASREIDRHAHVVRPKTTANERTALNSFMGYAGMDIKLKDITADTIRGFEAWLADRVVPNTAACYLRSLRSVLNRLGADGKELFRQVSTSGKKTRKRAVDIKFVKTIKNLQLEEGSKEALARDTFLLSILCMGIPFVDLAHLTRHHVRDGHIVYRRMKTGVEVSIAIEPCIQHIIDKYSKQSQPYLLPFLSSDGRKGTGLCHYQTALCNYNHQLKMLADRHGLPKLTSYTARHTWASLSYKMGTHIGIISKALGHTNPQTTMKYIKELDDSEVEQANRDIMSTLGY